MPTGWKGLAELTLDVDNQPVLSWTNAGFNLQSAPAVTGPFTNLPAATSPYTNPLAAPQQYFRLVAP